MKIKYITIPIILALLLYNTSCSKETANTDTSSSGQGGSTARFTIVGDYLYTVNASTMKTFNISNSEIPVYVNETDIGFGIETIFPYKNNLFIGAQTGMYIYDISSPMSPLQLSLYEHIYSCDPVVVQDTLAFVTLRSEDSWCGRLSNELHIIDIRDLNKPTLLKIYLMTSPYGLGVDGNKLFICDNGLKVYDISDIYDIKKLHQFSIKANDVIPYNNLLIVTGDDGLYQYNYADDDLTFLSKIGLDQTEL